MKQTREIFFTSGQSYGKVVFDFTSGPLSSHPVECGIYTSAISSVVSGAAAANALCPTQKQIAITYQKHDFV